MSPRNRVRLAVLALAFSVWLVATAATAFAAGPTLAIADVSFSERTVEFSSAYETGTASVALIVNSAEVTRTAANPAQAGVAMLPATLPMTCTIEAATYDGGGSLISKSAPLAFSGADYAPYSVTLPLKQNRIVPPVYGFRMATTARVTSATVYLNGKVAWAGPVTVANGGVTLPPIAVRYGRGTARIVGTNAWGARSSATVTIYQLGKTLPAYWRYVLVDKGDYYLYYISGYRVVSRYPIAIGTPWTPTPTGTFRLSYPQPAGGVWGVIRMPLQRRVHGGFVRTRFYIHGTNDPNSIGTAASHGCIRMHNRDVLRLASQLRAYPKRPYTIIRN
jgi:hypothetical protein